MAESSVRVTLSLSLSEAKALRWILAREFESWHEVGVSEDAEEWAKSMLTSLMWSLPDGAWETPE